ncbi:hypothetical protein NC652_030222 [Populus alba x Populus x berolinensis]|nr:hypothetical protein NC652_030222 [Populus alba x Populus x berolinensis]
MAEAEKTGRNTIKGKMGDRKEAENKTSSKSKWPLIKHKKNLQITRLKENDLFTVSFIVSFGQISVIYGQDLEIAIMPTLVF